MHRPLLAALLALATLPVAAPAHADDAGVWSSQLINLDFRKPGEKRGFQLSFDFHERAWGSTYLAIIRPGLGYDIGHGMTFWVGYAFVPTEIWDGVTPWKYENRIWEQFLANEKVGTVALTGRLRFEQRFPSVGGGVGERVRILGRGGFFFSKTSTWGWAVWDEVLVNLVSTDLYTAGFDQNRAFTGPFFQAKSGVRVEFGYMNFLVDKHGDLGLHDSHVAMTNLYVPVSVFGAKKKMDEQQARATAPTGTGGLGTALGD